MSEITLSNRGKLAVLLATELVAACSAPAPQPALNPDGSVRVTREPSAETTVVATPGYGQEPAGVTPVAPDPTNPNDPNYVRNGLTGAFYRRIADPMGLGRECFEVGTYVEPYVDSSGVAHAGDPQTTVGAATALGDPNSYKDAAGAINVTVYDQNSVEVGSFTTNALPDHETFSAEDPGWKVCNNGLTP